MRGKAMKNICRRLAAMKINLSQFCALEFYAREGDWQATAYADKVKSLEAWEVNPAHILALRKNLPKAAIRVGDSFGLAQKSTKKFNFVVLDNPMGITGAHCEHFGALNCLPKLLKLPAIVIFNINKNPYGDNPEWQQRRLEYYKGSEPDIAFYSNIFKGLGLATEFAFEVPRNEFISYLVFGLNENSHTSA